MGLIEFIMMLNTAAQQSSGSGDAIMGSEDLLMGDEDILMGDE
jgi:hypothetical protein